MEIDYLFIGRSTLNKEIQVVRLVRYWGLGFYIFPRNSVSPLPKALIKILRDRFLRGISSDEQGNVINKVINRITEYLLLFLFPQALILKHPSLCQQ